MAYDDVVYAPTRVSPLQAFRAGARLAFQFQNGPDVPTPVTDGKYFYSINDQGIMFCLDAKTGQSDLRRPKVEAGHLQRLPGAGRREDLHHE